MQNELDTAHGVMLAQRCADIYAEHQRTWDGKDGGALREVCERHKAAAAKYIAWNQARKERLAQNSATGTSEKSESLDPALLGGGLRIQIIGRDGPCGSELRLICTVRNFLFFFEFG